jgi:hypothetical protein
MPEQWQKALEHWGAWDKSIKRTRAKIEKEHGNISELLERAETIWPEGVDDPARLIQDAKMNKEAKVLWNLYDEVENIGSEFITKEIGLKSGLYLNYIFLNYWIHSVIPELTQDYEPDYYLPEYQAKADKRKVWPYSRVIRRPGKVVIIDSVNWIRGEISPSEIPALIGHMRWRSSDRLLKGAAGGRPSEQNKADMEAIVCYVLRCKKGLTEGGIGRIFDWQTRKNNYNQLVSRQVRKRLKRAKDLIQIEAHRKIAL